MKKTILLLLLAVLAVPVFAQGNVDKLNDGEGNSYIQLMTTHLLRDAAVGAADSLHISDRGWGRFVSLAYPKIDSVAIFLRTTDSAQGRLILEQYALPGVKDTVGIEWAATGDAGNTVRFGWFEINNALGGQGIKPPLLDAHTQIHTYGTTYAGAPQVATETFDMWMILYRSDP